MARGLLNVSWVLRLLCVLQMVETVSGARAPSSGSHISSQFPASGVSQTSVVDCREVCGLNASDRCAFVRTNPDCRSDGGYLDYLEGIFCHFPARLLPLAITLYAFWLVYLFLILGVTAAKFFCPNLSAISTTLKLSHNVAGVTFLAFGNGAPDIFSALVAFSDPRTAGLAFGALFGAGVLVTTVVAGGIAILRPFTAASRPFLRDIIFYMAAVLLIFTALYRGRVTLAWALGYLGFYMFYVVTVVLCTWIYQWQRRRSLVCSMPATPGFPGGAAVKNPPADVGDPRHVDLILGSGRSPGEGNGYPLQCSRLGNPKDRRTSLADYSPWDCEESDTDERTHTHTHTPHTHI